MIDVGNPTPVYSKLCRGSSVQWSEDNRLAVNVEGGVIILPACCSSGGGAAVGEFPDRRPIDIRAHPGPGSRELTRQLAAPKLGAREGGRVGQGVESTSHCWSPLGFSSCGGCLLTVVSRDHKILVYDPAAGEVSSHWQPVHDMSTEILSFLRTRNLLENPPALSITRNSVVSKLDSFQKTLPDTEAKCQGNRVALPPSAANKRQLPPRKNKRRATTLERDTGSDDMGTATVRQPATRRLRRCVRDSGASTALDPVQTMAVIPKPVGGSGAQTPFIVPVVAEPVEKPTAQTTLSHEDASIAVSRMHSKVARGSKQEWMELLPTSRITPKVDSLATLATAIAYRFFWLRRTEPPDPVPTYESLKTHLKAEDMALLDRAIKDVCDEHHHYVHNAQHSHDTIAGEGRRRIRQLWDRVRDPDAKFVQLSELETAVAGPWSPPKLMGPEELQDALGVIDWNKVQTSLADAFARRFLVLRQEIPEAEVPRYSKGNEHLKGHDCTLLSHVISEIMAAYETQLAEKLKYKDVEMLGRKRLRVTWDRAKDPSGEEALRELQLKSEYPSPFDSTPDEAYQVPGSFDPAVELPWANASSIDACKATLPLSFVLRWFMLREKIPPSDWEVYKYGDSVRNKDAELVKQAQAEVEAGFGALMEEQGYPIKTFQLDIKRLFRRYINAILASGKKEGEGPSGQMESPDADADDWQPCNETVEMLQERVRRRIEDMKMKLSRKLGSLGLPVPLAHDDAFGMPQIPVKKKSNSVPMKRTGPRQVRLPDDVVVVPAAVYELGIASVSLTHAAWSPTCTLGGSNGGETRYFSFLAVGAKSGYIYLWRVWSTSSAAGLDMSSRAQLVGLVDAAVGGWASCVSWALVPGSVPSKVMNAPNSPADQLCLAVGSSDGSCRLFGGRVNLLGQQEPPVTMELWGTLWDSDERPISCLDMLVAGPSLQGDLQILVAAGRHAGHITVWQSPIFSTGIGPQAALAQQHGALFHCPFAHGAKPLSGVQLVRIPSTASVPSEARAMLYSSGFDGTVRSWHITRSACNPALDLRLNPDGEDCAIYGISLSPSHLLLATVQSLDASGLPMFELLQAFEGLDKGEVRLYRLCGPGTSVDVSAALTEALDKLLDWPLNPARTAEIATVLRAVATNAPSGGRPDVGQQFLLDGVSGYEAEHSEDGTGYSTEGEDEMDPQDQVDEVLEDGDSEQFYLVNDVADALSICTSPLIQDVLRHLEGDLDSLRDSLLTPDRRRWQGLQAAVALRNLLAPTDHIHRLQVCVRARGQAGRMMLDAAGMLALSAWPRAISDNEELLLQRYVAQELSTVTGRHARPAEPRHMWMIDWVNEHRGHPHICPELLQLVPERPQTSEPNGSSSQAENMEGLESSHLALQPNANSLLDSARFKRFSVEGGILSLPQCAASFQLCGVQKEMLTCYVCDRLYLEAPPNNGAVTGCIYCGTPLGGVEGHIWRAWPGTPTETC